MLFACGGRKIDDGEIHRTTQTQQLLTEFLDNVILPSSHTKRQSENVHSP